MTCGICWNIVSKNTHLVPASPHSDFGESRVGREVHSCSFISPLNWESGWIEERSPAVPSKNTRGTTQAVFVFARNTCVMPFWDVTLPVRADEEIVAGLRAVHGSDLRGTVGSQVSDLVDPESIAEVRNLHNDGRLIERSYASAVSNILVWAGRPPLLVRA